MASEESSPRRRKSRAADDDMDVPSIKKPDSGNRALWIVLIGGGGLVLLMCLIAIGIGAIISFSARDTQAERFVGSWKGRFVLRGQPMDVVYHFSRDGNLREEVFNPQGQRIQAGGGKWRIRGGEVEIDWDGGSFENATANFVDRNTMHYRIVDHSEFAQIGMTGTFRRQ